MKYLIYELFSGVGFCNQLFSLETAIYLSNILDRKLILLVKYPLCHCGSSSWDYGNFLDFFSDDYKQFLPHGIDVYYKNIPVEILDIIKNKSICQELPFRNKLSHIVIVDNKLAKDKSKLKDFCHNRTLFMIDFSIFNKREYLYTNKSNASRCFYNFYTTQENYILMSKICESLTHLNKSFNLLNYNLNYNYISVHLRLGDRRHSKETIDNNSRKFYDSLKKQLNTYSKNKKIILMADRQDGEMIKKLKEDYSIIFTEDILKTIHKNDYFKHYKRQEVVDFLIQQQICANGELLIGYEGSTVSNYIHYLNYIHFKDTQLYVNRTIHTEQNKYTWMLNDVYGPKIAFGLFFPENIIRTNVKIITLTNDGYKQLTDNLLYSMKLLGIDKQLKIYCIGDDCYQHYKFKNSFNEVEKIDTEDYLKNWIEYRSCQNKDIEGKKQWATITSYKLFCIYNELIKDNDIIFIDGDIVFEKNPFYHLLENIKDNDLLIQNDNQSYNERQFCTGFFYMKSNEITKKITNFEEIKKNIDQFQNDQQYLRRYEKELKVEYLSLDLFPNGKYWREKKPNNPYIIHFNYDVSEHKIKRMKQFKKWYLDNNIQPKTQIKSVNKPELNKNEVSSNLNDYMKDRHIIIRQGYLTQSVIHTEKIYNFINGYFKDIHKIVNVLEIGFLAGHSAEFFLNLNNNINVTSIDIGSFQSVKYGKTYIDLNYLRRHKLIKGASKVKLLEMDKNIKYDIIFIDGSYEYDDVKLDIQYCKEFAKPDTLLIVNNVLKHSEYIKYWNKGPTKLWNENVKNNVIKSLELIDIEMGRGSALGNYNNIQYHPSMNNSNTNVNYKSNLIIKSNRNTDLFSSLLGIVYQAFINIKKDKVPYIVWNNPNYITNENDNIFNYFFEQEDVTVSKYDNNIFEDGINVSEILLMAKTNNITFREQMNMMFHKVCKIKENYIDLIDKLSNEYDISNTYGVQLNLNPHYLSNIELKYGGINISLIQQYLKSKDIYNIYFVTDCENTYNNFSNDFNCYSNVTIRTKENKENKKRAEEEFIEGYILSKSKFLYRLSSSVSIFAMIINPNLLYEDLLKTYKIDIMKENSLEFLVTQDFLEF